MDLDTPEPAPEIDSKANVAANANAVATATAADDDSDPIIASYNVFTNPALATTRKILLLQHPHKPGPGSDAHLPPAEVRIKPASGMIEVDVPLSYQDPGYDRDKGMKWGQALIRSMGAKSGGSHGLAGGFGIGVPAARGGRRVEGDKDVYEWTEAVRRDQVLRTQTMGGMYRDGEECRWMVGVFKGGNLHLTPATSEIQLRPQLHHLDALSEQERLARPREGLGQGPGLGGKDGATAAPPAPKAIHMTIKSAASGSEQLHTETMADRLRIVQMEPWQRLKYVGDEEAEAWDTYDKTLFFRAGAGQGDAKGKGKEKDDSKDKSKDGATDALDPETVRLRTRWREEDFLRAIAGKDRAGVLEGYGSTAAGAAVKDEDEVEFIKSEEHEAPLNEMGKKGAAAASAPSAAGARGKGKAAATSSSSMPPPPARKGAAAKSKASVNTGKTSGSAMEID